MARVGDRRDALTRSKQTEPAPGFARTKASQSDPGVQKRSRCGPALRTGDRSSREPRVAARRDVSSPPSSRAHTHTRSIPAASAHAPILLRADAHARAPRGATTCGSPGRTNVPRRRIAARFLRCQRASGSAAAATTTTHPSSSPRRSTSACVSARARGTSFAKIGWRARAHTRARVYVKRTPCQTAHGGYGGAESRVKPAGLPKLGGPARIGGSCGATRRDSPRENSAGNQM